MFSRRKAKKRSMYPGPARAGSRSLIEKMYGADVFTYDAINELFPGLSRLLLRKQTWSRSARPEVSVDAANETEGVSP